MKPSKLRKHHGIGKKCSIKKRDVRFGNQTWQLDYSKKWPEGGWVSPCCRAKSDFWGMQFDAIGNSWNQWLMIIILIKWLFHWEYTLFSNKPKPSKQPKQGKTAKNFRSFQGTPKVCPFGPTTVHLAATPGAHHWEKNPGGELATNHLWLIVVNDGESWIMMAKNCYLVAN